VHALERWVVVRVEVVEAQHIVTARAEGEGAGRADEPRRLRWAGRREEERR
jgi:hypothetical protein